jgi:hypothetical protein
LEIVNDARGALGVPPGWRYASLEGLVLAEGRDFVSAPLTAEQHKYLRAVLAGTSRRFPWKECFATSQRVKLLRDFEARLDYYEGWAVSSAIPVHHGWLVLDGERIIDLTWRKTGLAKVRLPLERTRIFGAFPEGWEYRGVRAASREQIRERIAQRQEWSSFLDDWRDGYPMLRNAEQGSTG